MPKKSQLNPNSYTPNSSLIALMDEILQFEHKKIRRKLEGEKLSPSEEKMRSNISRKKNYVLNNFVFPSMANIIFFLEFVNKDRLVLDKKFYEPMRTLFDKDIKNLTGLTSFVDWLFFKKGNEIRDIHRFDDGRQLMSIPTFAFGRLISAFINYAVSFEWDNERRSAEPGFRFLLLQAMQEHITSILIDDGIVRNSYRELAPVMEQDMKRANSWVMFLSKIALEKVKPELIQLSEEKTGRHRPLKF